jgi:hypothetical protein
MIINSLRAQRYLKIYQNPGDNAREIEVEQFWSDIPETDQSIVLDYIELYQAQDIFESQVKLLDKLDSELDKINNELNRLNSLNLALNQDRALISSKMSNAHEKMSALREKIRS